MLSPILSQSPDTLKELIKVFFFGGGWQGVDACGVPCTLLINVGRGGAICKHRNRTQRHSNTISISCISFVCQCIELLAAQSHVHEVTPYTPSTLFISFLQCKMSWNPFDVNSNYNDYGASQHVYAAGGEDKHLLTRTHTHTHIPLRHTY